MRPSNILICACSPPPPQKVCQPKHVRTAAGMCPFALFPTQYCGATFLLVNDCLELVGGSGADNVQLRLY